MKQTSILKASLIFLLYIGLSYSSSIKYPQRSRWINSEGPIEPFLNSNQKISGNTPYRLPSLRSEPSDDNFKSLPFLDSDINFDYLDNGGQQHRHYYSKPSELYSERTTTTPSSAYIPLRKDTKKVNNQVSKNTYVRESLQNHRDINFEKPSLQLHRLKNEPRIKTTTTDPAAETTSLPSMSLQEKLKLIYQMQNGQIGNDTEDDSNDYYYYYYYDDDAKDVDNTEDTTPTPTNTPFIPTLITEITMTTTTLPTTTVFEMTTLINFDDFNGDVSCTLGEKFCESSSSNYPLQIVEEAVLTEGQTIKVKYQSVVDELSKFVDVGLVKNHQFKPKTGMCEIQESIIKPGWGKNIDNEWLVVINTKDYNQELKVVHCRSVNASCGDNMESRSQCIQNYSRQKLMVINPKSPEKGIYVSKFDVPTSCSCPSTTEISEVKKPLKYFQTIPRQGLKKTTMKFREITPLPSKYQKESVETTTHRSFLPYKRDEDKYKKTFPRNYLKDHKKEQQIDRKWSPSNLKEDKDEPIKWSNSNRRNSYTKSESVIPTIPTSTTSSKYAYQRRRTRPQLHRLQDKYRTHLLKLNKSPSPLPTLSNEEMIETTTEMTFRIEETTEKEPEEPQTQPPNTNKNKLALLLQNESDPIKIRQIIANYKKSLKKDTADDPPKISSRVSETVTESTLPNDETFTNPPLRAKPFSAKQWSVSTPKNNYVSVEDDEQEDEDKSIFSELNFYRNKNKYRRLDQNIKNTKILSSIQKKYAYTGEKSTPLPNQDEVTTTTTEIITTEKVTLPPFVPTKNQEILNQSPLFIIENETDNAPNTEESEYLTVLSSSVDQSKEEDKIETDFVTNIFENDLSFPDDHHQINVKKPIRDTLNVFDELRLSFGFR